MVPLHPLWGCALHMAQCADFDPTGEAYDANIFCAEAEGSLTHSLGGVKLHLT